MYTSLSKKRTQPVLQETPVTRERTERDLAWCVGAEQFRHRDPLYHITESFCETFDFIGRQRAVTIAAEGGSGFSEEERREQPEQTGTEEPQEKQEDGQREKPRDVTPASPIQRFSEMAFQRGGLSASVIAGTGKMMLVSCLKRTAGQSGPKRLQEQQILGIGAQKRNVPGRDPDQALFHRGFTNSAVGLVVDTLRDARRSVETLADLARGDGAVGEQGSGTLRTMYPFLDDSRETLLLEQYRERLEHAEDPRERAALQSAIGRSEALRAKKAQMKNEFINKLRFVSDRATETLAELDRPGAADEIYAAAFDAESAAAEDGADDDREGTDAADEAENGFAPTDGAGTGAE